jgi:hypothetical protein
VTFGSGRPESLKTFVQYVSTSLVTAVRNWSMVCGRVGSLPVVMRFCAAAGRSLA